MLSIVQERGNVHFPRFAEERIYMRKFFKRNGLPRDLSRWQATVSEMLDGIETDKPIYLMVDQARVRAGTLHRRPGLHIDGYWSETLQTHPAPGPHPGHATKIKDNSEEALILASDIVGCRGFVGKNDCVPGIGGDCSHISTCELKPILMQARKVYAGNVSMLHESIPVAENCLRTVVRLNVPGWSPRA